MLLLGCAKEGVPILYCSATVLALLSHGEEFRCHERVHPFQKANKHPEHSRREERYRSLPFWDVLWRPISIPSERDIAWELLTKSWYQGFRSHNCSNWLNEWIQEDTSTVRTLWERREVLTKAVHEWIGVITTRIESLLRFVTRVESRRWSEWSTVIKPKSKNFLKSSVGVQTKRCKGAASHD